MLAPFLFAHPPAHFLLTLVVYAVTGTERRLRSHVLDLVLGVNGRCWTSFWGGEGRRGGVVKSSGDVSGF